MKKITSIGSTGDSSTQDHQRRVSILSVWIGQQMALPSEQIENIRVIGLVHDIGKVVLPTGFSIKTDNLNAFERLIVNKHPQAGFDILEGTGLSATVKQAVLQHHERINGSGYPNQLMGDQILVEAKVVSVADVIDAMSSNRPYNAKLGINDALEEISKNRGIHYDESVVDACLSIFSMATQYNDAVTAIDSFLNQQLVCC